MSEETEKNELSYKEDEEEIIKDDTRGTVIIEDQVIFEYISEEVLKFDEVSRFVGGITDSFSKNILGRDTNASGIKLVRDGSNITVNLNLVMYYGVNIPQVAYDIQSSVKEAVESFTGLSVDAVNISIDGVDKRKDPE